MNIYHVIARDETQREIVENVIENSEGMAQTKFLAGHEGAAVVSVDLIRENVTASKDQERAALASIMQIVKNLGPESYLSSAFQGCFELAEENLANDFLFSFPGRLDSAACQIADLTKQLSEVSVLKKRIASLEQELERELEWKPYASKFNVEQADYMELAGGPGTERLTDEQAANLIVRELGFAQEKVRIVHSVDQEEINRHHRVRKVGEIERMPLYNASDWNYVRFDCAGRCYELFNGELRPFYC